MFNKPPQAAIVFRQDDGQLVIDLRGRLDANRATELWRPAMRLLEDRRPQRLILQADQVDYCDGNGAALLLGLKYFQQQAGRQAEVVGLREDFAGLLKALDAGPAPAPPARPPLARHSVELVGMSVAGMLGDLRQIIAFVGELSAAMALVVLRPRRMRWKEALLAAQAAGVNAVGIVALLGFLIGLILAFQSAMPLRKFGAEIYVADLVGIAHLRELGPLITAVLLAGRTGSAIAAEVGTMKVNEELDALTTMGLDPLRWLTPPRVLAAILVMPVLTLVADFAGLVGGGILMRMEGFPVDTYIREVQGAVVMGDLNTGLFKSAIFGLLVAAIGCLRGFQTATGARAVGESATRAVVSGIILIILADGLIGLLFFYLGI